MTKLSKIPANEIGIQIIDASDGLSYFVGATSEAAGGQCGHCQAVIWVHGRLNRILTEPYPRELPDTGPEYRAYRKDKIRRFLDSLPQCPVCGYHNYNRFITRGELACFPEDCKNLSIEKINPSAAQIWLWEDDISPNELRKN